MASHKESTVAGIQYKFPRQDRGQVGDSAQEPKGVEWEPGSAEGWLSQSWDVWGKDGSALAHYLHSAQLSGCVPSASEESCRRLWYRLSKLFTPSDMRTVFTKDSLTQSTLSGTVLNASWREGHLCPSVTGRAWLMGPESGHICGQGEPKCPAEDFTLHHQDSGSYGRF